MKEYIDFCTRIQNKRKGSLLKYERKLQRRYSLISLKKIGPKIQIISRLVWNGLRIFLNKNVKEISYRILVNQVKCCVIINGNKYEEVW